MKSLFLIFFPLFLLNEPAYYYHVAQFGSKGNYSFYIGRRKMNIVMKVPEWENARGCKIDTLEEINLTIKVLQLSEKDQLTNYIKRYLSARKKNNNWNSSSGYSMCGLEFSFNCQEPQYSLYENLCCWPNTVATDSLINKLNVAFNKLQCQSVVKVQPDSSYTDTIISESLVRNVKIVRDFKVINRRN